MVMSEEQKGRGLLMSRREEPWRLTVNLLHIGRATNLCHKSLIFQSHIL
jgi:hypothetical protein